MASLALLVSVFSAIIFAISQSKEPNRIIREGHTFYEIPIEYLEKNWTEYIFTNNSDILSPSATTNWCKGLYVSPMFTDDTILQRAPQSAAIFGYGTPYSKVTVTFNNKQYTTTIQSNNTKLGLSACSWRISLPPTDDSNNPNGMQRYTISITSDITNASTINLNNVTFGDIWVCTGLYMLHILKMYTADLCM